MRACVCVRVFASVPSHVQDEAPPNVEEMVSLLEVLTKDLIREGVCVCMYVCQGVCRGGGGGSWAF